MLTKYKTANKLSCFLCQKLADWLRSCPDHDSLYELGTIEEFIFSSLCNEHSNFLRWVFGNDPKEYLKETTVYAIGSDGYSGKQLMLILGMLSMVSPL
jgi:hypothetical protein